MQKIFTFHTAFGDNGAGKILLYALLHTTVRKVRIFRTVVKIDENRAKKAFFGTNNSAERRAFDARVMKKL